MPTSTDPPAAGPSPDIGRPTPLVDHDANHPSEDPAAGVAASPSDDPAARRTIGDRANSVAKRVVAVLIAIALLVIAYFILEAFLPRWWAQQIGQRVDGSFSRGIGTGLVLGIVCTFVPLLLFTLAVVNRGRLRNVPAIVFGIAGIIVAIPNLLSLAVVVGRGNGSHAGQRILDVDAPGFRGASLWGAVVGVLFAVLMGYFIWRYRRRGRQLRASREREKEAAALAEPTPEA
ncbi:hypothetical protein GS4_33_00740 [Gordonia soli NBRC 108243]|uniref:Permease n=1 Tax=Gordonia soli NBRC 108243 TaxID=1223545 RepID=M0QPC6_9ACTN|nr:hypothetical protein GS4_33_00740 [Gordonia soli NBRC 108243]